MRELLCMCVHDGVVHFPLFLSLPSCAEIQPYLEGKPVGFVVLSLAVCTGLVLEQ